MNDKYNFPLYEDEFENLSNLSVKYSDALQKMMSASPDKMDVAIVEFRCAQHDLHSQEDKLDCVLSEAMSDIKMNLYQKSETRDNERK